MPATIDDPAILGEIEGALKGRVGRQVFSSSGPSDISSR